MAFGVVVRRASQGREGVVVGSAVRACGGCGRNEWNAAIIRGQQRRAGCVGGESNAELAENDNDEEGRRLGVCYGGICTVGVVVRRGKERGCWGI